MQNFSHGNVPVKDNKASSLLELAKTELAELYAVEELDNIAHWLIEHYAHISRSQLHQQPHLLVNQSDIILFSNAVDELKKGAPVQYVIGVVDFYGLKLSVDPSVLIPRPETEELVDIIIKENKNDKALKILDIGTGSGCIALSLAKHFTLSQVTAVDISADALNVARKNAINNHINNIKFLELDFLKENNFIEKEFDIIVSNPPYIAASESTTMSKNVLDFEPSTALFVPNEDPLIFYTRIAEMAKTHLKRGGVVYVEINERLGDETRLAFSEKPFTSVHLLKDMFGKNRFIKAVGL